MEKKWHNKHIPTKWGVGILGVLLLGLIIFVSQIGQTQNLFSQASGTSVAQGVSIYFPRSISYRNSKTTSKTVTIDIPIQLKFGSSTPKHLFVPDYYFESILLGNIYYNNEYFTYKSFSAGKGFRATIKPIPDKEALNITLTGHKNVARGDDYLLGTLTMVVKSKPPGGVTPKIYFQQTEKIGARICTVNKLKPPRARTTCEYAIINFGNSQTYISY